MDLVREGNCAPPDGFVVGRKMDGWGKKEKD